MDFLFDLLKNESNGRIRYNGKNKSAKRKETELKAKI